jgi:hypothetical protein
MTISERRAQKGELATFRAVVESLENPQNYSHEEIFDWHPSRIESFLRDLFDLMGHEDQETARDLIDLDTFDFFAAKQKALDSKKVAHQKENRSFYYARLSTGMKMRGDDFEDARTC